MTPDHRVHVQHLLGDIVHALEQLARCFTEYQETMVSERRQRYDQMMNKALKNLIELLPGLDETLALNRPAMNESWGGKSSWWRTTSGSSWRAGGSGWVQPS